MLGEIEIVIRLSWWPPLFLFSLPLTYTEYLGGWLMGNTRWGPIGGVTVFQETSSTKWQFRFNKCRWYVLAHSQLWKDRNENLFQILLMTPVTWNQLLRGRGNTHTPTSKLSLSHGKQLPGILHSHGCVISCKGHVDFLGSGSRAPYLNLALQSRGYICHNHVIMLGIGLGTGLPEPAHFVEFKFNNFPQNAGR